jgi:cell division septum initiation protein DivIVA
MPERDDTLALAKAEADAILAEAQEQAERLMRAAKHVASVDDQEAVKADLAALAATIESAIEDLAAILQEIKKFS